jgi:hypothetical protein
MAACIWAITREGPVARTPVLRRHALPSGRAAAPVWRNPRRRYAVARNPRASLEAGARRMPVRWDPTHG